MKTTIERPCNPRNGSQAELHDEDGQHRHDGEVGAKAVVRTTNMKLPGGEGLRPPMITKMEIGSRHPIVLP